MTDAAHTSLDKVVRPPNLIYGVDEWPPPLQLALLGLQYAVVSAIYLVLVAIIVRHSGADAETSLRVMRIACVGLAIGTVLQALPRGPVGSGFLAPPVFSAVYLAPSLLAAEAGGMPLVFGMTLFAGAVEVCFGLLLHRLRLLITPILSGLTVLIVGLQLGLVGIGELLDVKDEHQTFFAHHLIVTTMTLAICIFLSIWGRGVWKMTCSLLGLIVGMVGAYIVGIVSPANLSALADAPWFAVPVPLFFDLKFDAALIPAFLAAGIAGALRSVGVLTTCQRLNNAAWQRPDSGNLKRGILADGLANVIGGSIGVTGMCSAPSLVGISGATGATSRAIAYSAAALPRRVCSLSEAVRILSHRADGGRRAAPRLHRFLHDRRWHGHNGIEAARDARHLHRRHLRPSGARTGHVYRLFRRAARYREELHRQHAGRRPHRRDHSVSAVPLWRAPTQEIAMDFGAQKHWARPSMTSSCRRRVGASLPVSPT